MAAAAGEVAGAGPLSAAVSQGPGSCVGPGRGVAGGAWGSFGSHCNRGCQRFLEGRSSGVPH